MVSELFQNYFKIVSKSFQNRFKIVSKSFHFGSGPHDRAALHLSGVDSPPAPVHLRSAA
jgi:hypothetical protein